MILVWRGAGIFAIVTFVAPLLLAGFGAEALWGREYASQHLWPFFVGLTISVAATWFAGKWLDARPGRVVRDAHTGAEVVIKSAHDLFYVPFRYWAIIGGAVGCSVFVPLTTSFLFDERDTRASALAAQAPVSASAPDWHALLAQGKKEKTNGNFLRAEPLLQQALNAAEKASNSEAIALAPILEALGQVQRHREEWVPAEASLRRALALQETAHGRNSAYVALALDSLAEVFLDQSDAVRAEPLLEEAQSILEKLPHPKEDDRALILNDLGALRYLQNRYDDATASWRRSLDLREHDDPNGSSGESTRYNLAMLANAQGHKDEAKKLFQAALAASEKSHGATHPDTGLAAYRLAEWYLENDAPHAHAVETVPLLERVISIYEAAYGQADAHLIEPIKKLAALQNRLDHSQKAEALYLRQLEVAGDIDSDDARYAVSNARRSLIEIYSKRGDQENAAAQRSLYQQAFRDAHDSSDVRSAFGVYKAQISKGHGTETAALLTASTYAYYDRLRELALYGARPELASLSSIDLLNVLILRHQIPVNQLRQFASGQSLVADLISRGWIGSGEVDSFTIVAIHVNGDEAIVDLKTADDGALDYRFHREGKAWKMDLARVLQASSAQWDAQAKSAGMKIEDYLILRLSGGKYGVVDASIWNPPLTRAAKR